jgi:hypothetical protein
MRMGPPKRLVSWSVALVALLLLATASPAAAKRPHGLYWGAWMGDQLTGSQPPYDMSAVSRFEGIVDKGLSMIEFARPFSECEGTSCSSLPFPTPQMQAIRNYGAIPVLSWSSAATPGEAEQPEYQLSDVLNGSYDASIEAFAREAAAWGHPFFLRFDWEMNGNWFPWSGAANGNRPRQYVQAWRHVHRIFAAAGADNATWVWCPYASSERPYNQIRRYYPGGKFVDWTCMDGYNWGRNSVNSHKWMSFDRIFASTYTQITRRIAPGKPVLLGEIASNGSGKAKATWIRQMFRSLMRGYPQIGGLVWFDQFDRGVNWPLEGSNPVLRAFTGGLRGNPFFGPRFSRLAATPIPSLR